MIERKRFLGMLGSGLIGGLFVNPFKEERTWIWFKLYDYKGNFEGWQQIDTTDWVHQPDMSEGLGYSRLVTEDGTYVASETKAPSNTPAPLSLMMSYTPLRLS